MGSATRRRVANCAVPCRSAWCGARRRVRFAFIPTKRSPVPFAPSSTNSRNSDRHAKSGYGSVRNICLFRCTPWAWCRPSLLVISFAGSSPPTSPFITCSAIRCMLARTYMVRPVTIATSMSTVPSENEFVIFRRKSGLCFFPGITKVSSIGQRMKPTPRPWPAGRSCPPAPALPAAFAASG